MTVTHASDPLNVAIAGVAGRMGRQLTTASLAAGLKVVGGSETADSDHLTQDIGVLAGGSAIGINPLSDTVTAAANAHVWIDFTRPEATLAALDTLAHTRVRAAVIGTTGFSAAQEDDIRTAAKRLAIVKAGNFSVGVNLLQNLTRLAAEHLGPDWDIEILETHHRHKVDAPSGTALMLGESAAAGRKTPLTVLQSKPYLGPEAARRRGHIGFSVRRSGGVIGDHEVTFASPQELITLSHSALDRNVFAEGAITAARWVAAQPPGLYGMDDVLGLTHR
jgi:4-hydroxy-tetrahydrodipicolinate reductase